jgi:hypothetical protein
MGEGRRTPGLCPRADQQCHEQGEIELISSRASARAS